MNYFKVLQTILLIAVGLAAFVGFPYYYKQNQLNKDRVDQVTRYALIDRDSAIIYKNKYEQAVYQVETARLDKQTIKALREDLQEITSRFDGVNKRLNNVESLSKVTISAVASLQGTSQDTVLVRDSVAVAAFQFEAFDPHFRVEGVVIPTLKKVEVTPTFSANVYAVTYWKRKHKFLGMRFGKKEYRSEITSDNPYLKFSDYKVVMRKEPL